MRSEVVFSQSGLEDKGRQLNSTTVRTEYKYPLCPYCYEGFIVEDNNKKGVYFCNRCFNQIIIRPFKDTLNR